MMSKGSRSKINGVASDLTLNDQSFRCPSKVLCREFRVRILSILPGEICFYYPTVSRAEFSNEDRNLELNDFSERLAERWPTDCGDVVGDNSSH